MAYLLIGLAVIAVAFITRKFLAWKRLRHIPGPFGCGWFDLWVLRRAFRGTLYKDLGNLCDKYGPLVRIAPEYLVCGDPIEVRRIWGVRSQFDRAPWFKGFQLDPPNDCSLSIRDSTLHSLLRSKLSPGYSGKDIDGLHESIDQQVAKFLRFIEEKYLSTETDFRPIDFARKIQFLTLDLISTFALGRTFGFMDKDEDLFDYIKTTEESLPLMQMIALLPGLLSVLQSPLFKVIRPTHTDAVGLSKVMGIAKEIVSERYGNSKMVKRDMLGSFVAHGLTKKDAESESLVQIVAGSDTTATVIRIGIFHAPTSPLVYQNLQEEIDRGVKAGQTSAPIKDTEARTLPFLQAFIKECFRIWPPITGIVPRVSGTEAAVCGHRVPANTNVGWSARSVMRDRNVFGDDSDLFSPEQWLRTQGEQLRAMENTIELEFGQGKWGCLGKPIALLELNKVFVELLRRFDFTVVNPAHPMDTFDYCVMTQFNLMLRITKRKIPV
ncbi:uncharacterized protein A1O5_11393 [Cladophialophora psammophila CBS 110553]|uniref:Cytochrome P450 oxidoreductase n=1 Tax=Cladophialophora psammophila CBS 110553 TaxID=1182543 RepID=W9W6A9_9EURO|nr:uncharacterized protein A1O5_11393 [Cladophialophora psammophila CBS 110553]EXJ63632.1 hypothetical protein A1O5_11393 [Cladophialophora psammophila CBS 110553]